MVKPDHLWMIGLNRTPGAINTGRQRSGASVEVCRPVEASRLLAASFHSRSIAATPGGAPFYDPSKTISSPGSGSRRSGRLAAAIRTQFASELARPLFSDRLPVQCPAGTGVSARNASQCGFSGDSHVWLLMGRRQFKRADGRLRCWSQGAQCQCGSGADTRVSVVQASGQCRYNP